MSRSRKKHPYVNVVNTEGKEGKKFATKKVRNSDDLPSAPGAFKKLFTIDRWRHRWTKEEAIAKWENASKGSWLRRKYPTLESYLKYWSKCVEKK